FRVPRRPHSHRSQRAIQCTDDGRWRLMWIDRDGGRLPRPTTDGEAQCFSVTVQQSLEAQAADREFLSRGCVRIELQVAIQRAAGGGRSLLPELIELFDRGGCVA